MLLSLYKGDCLSKSLPILQLPVFREIATILKIQFKQVDILISKNQALQILYLKHYVYNEIT